VLEEGATHVPLNPVAALRGRPDVVASSGTPARVAPTMESGGAQ
jgi:hypothetical protein